MTALEFKKKPQKKVKSYGLTIDAIKKLEELHERHKIPRSQIIDELLLSGDTDVDDFIFEYCLKAEVKARPRFAKGKAYTTQKNKKYESEVKEAVKQWWNDDPLKTALKINLTFQFEKPKKTTLDYPSKKDLDNLVKSFLDACNGIIFVDDSQVVEIKADKVFGVDDRIKMGFSEI